LPTQAAKQCLQWMCHRNDRPRRVERASRAALQWRLIQVHSQFVKEMGRARKPPFFYINQTKLKLFLRPKTFTLNKLDQLTFTSSKKILDKELAIIFKLQRHIQFIFFALHQLNSCLKIVLTFPCDSNTLTLNRYSYFF